jgi:hypothetical protein
MPDKYFFLPDKSFFLPDKSFIGLKATLNLFIRDKL